MTNMSYCRFHNTLVALRDCEGVFEDMLDGDPRSLSDEELIAAQQLVATCLNIVQILAERGAVYFEPDMDLSAVVKALNDAAN
ncbi:hypothetical protein [Lysobacter enzymogenes]|uniref:hypothetical protein n=1 Tax=Lysobacter enzymogenes TaxID=69 RepID=UPI0009D27A17|nr:hypothetical protein [Lysobacter enzymogenes]UZW61844.1 hypothetical protein BV903_005960 [Lysobacter enzymogenes]